MGLSEDIQELNKRIIALETKQEEVKRVLAVEEHKLSELEAQLKEEGYDVSKMTDEEIDTLLDKLAEDIEKESKRLKEVLTKAEEQFEKFQELR